MNVVNGSYIDYDDDNEKDGMQGGAVDETADPDDAENNQQYS